MKIIPPQKIKGGIHLDNTFEVITLLVGCVVLRIVMTTKKTIVRLSIILVVLILLVVTGGLLLFAFMHPERLPLM